MWATCIFFFHRRGENINNVKIWHVNIFAQFSCWSVVHEGLRSLADHRLGSGNLVPESGAVVYYIWTEGGKLDRRRDSL